jgi:hypothetical protein
MESFDLHLQREGPRARDDQKVTLPPNHQAESPRLGFVGETTLYINRRVEFGKPPTEADAAETASIETERVVPEQQSQTPVDDQRVLQVLGSLKRVAWYAVWILAVILIVTLLKH